MKICAISDVHGQFENLSIKPCELLLICGDIMPLSIQRNIDLSFNWFKKKFVPWCLSQSVEQILMVWGNHDFLGEKLGDECKEFLVGSNIDILDNEGATFVDKTGKSWSIWGSPLCHIFGKWAFMKPDSFNKMMYEEMPENVDILITHDAAYEHSDQCLGFMSPSKRELHRGNIPLKEVVEKKHPVWHFFGHLHTCKHEIVEYESTKTACVSLLNEQYIKTYPPLYLDI